MARSLLCNRESGTARDSPTTSNSDNEIKRQRHKLDSVAAATSTTTAVDTELNGKKKTTTAVAASIVAIRNQNPGKRGQTRECADNKVTRLARKFSSVCLKKEEPENRWRGQQPQPGSRPLSAHGLGGGKRLVNRTTTCSVAARTNTKIGTEEKMEEDDDAACRVRKTIRMFEIDSNRVKMKALRGSNSDVHATKANENGHYATAKDIDGNQLVLARNRLKPLVNVEQEKENPSWTSTSTVPVVFSKGDACARSDAYTTEALTENQASVDVRRRCFSMFAKQTQTYASFDVKTLKNRPLSVARPFCLEHASQDAPSPLPPPPMSSEERQTYSSADHLAAASATATAFNCETVDDGHVNVAKTTVPSTLISPPPLNKNSSFLHRSKDYSSRVLPVSADASASVRARYEHLFDTNGDAADAAAAAATATDDDSDNDYGYSNIYDNDVEFDGCYHLHSSNSDSTNNVYDTVLYSELNTRVEKRKEGDRDYDYDHGDRVEDGDDDDDGDDEAAYEVVSSLSRVNGQTDDSISNSSNSSLEKANSLYETKENESTYLTDLPTVTATAIVISNATSASVVSDDWLDIDIFERESADETGRGKIVFTKKRRMRIGAGKLKKIRRKKFRSHQNQRQSKISVCTGPTSTIYIADECENDDDNECKPYGHNGNGNGNGNSGGCHRTNDHRNGADSSGGGGGDGDGVTVLRSVLYLSPYYEAQEVSTSFSNNSDYNADVHIQVDDAVAQTQAVTTEYEIEKASAVDDNLAEEICDDFDDTSSEENDYANKSRRSSPLVSRASERSFLPNVNVHVQSQNIYEFMKKARKTMRKSWSSFNQQMRKSSTNNRPTVVGAVGLVNADKVSASASASASAPVKMRNNSCGSVDGCGAISSGGGSVRWTSFKTKLRPKYGTVSGANSSSIFYVNPEDLRFDRDERVSSRADVKYEKSSVGRRKTIYLEVNPSIPRPSSPPPPPPATAGAATDEDSGNLNGNGNDSGNGNGNGNGNDNSNDNDGRNDTRVLTDANYISNSPLSSSNSDFNLSSCSDLRLRFADEPLYQFYAESVAQLTTNASMLSERYSNDSSDGYEEIGSSTSRPSAMELITPSPNGHGQCRSLWCEVDEVKNSGILEKLSISRQKLQEAKFEVITSEASYYKSLSVLDRIFVNDTRLRDEKLLCKNDWKILFGNVAAVRKCSQLVLSDLEKCWQEDIMLSDLGNVVLEHASTNFKIFVKYCSNQIYIDRTLRKLREQNVNFVELISKLEADPVCQSLSLHSFLMLPMQRITRMPLLVDAILSKLEPIDDQDHSHLTTFKTTLAILNKIVKDCNESARKFERYEEMLLLSRQLEFSRKDVKMFSVASSSRWLVRSGPLLHLNPPDAKLTITRKLTKSATKLYFFLFNDVLVIAKKKSDDSYAVVDYCLRNVMQMNSVEDAIAPAQPSLSSSSSSSLSLSLSPSPSPSLVSLYSPHRYLLILTMLENHEGKTVEMVLSCDSDSTRQRWLEASYSRLTSDNPEEKLYEEWDCPQVLAVHDYLANQPDELSLQNGDVVKVLKKTTDGWYHGERIRDGIIGWFPGNYTIEIASQHTRAKNLKLRHRLLALSADYLQHHLQQK